MGKLFVLLLALSIFTMPAFAQEDTTVYTVGTATNIDGSSITPNSTDVSEWSRVEYNRNAAVGEKVLSTTHPSGAEVYGVAIDTDNDGRADSVRMEMQGSGNISIDEQAMFISAAAKNDIADGRIRMEDGRISTPESNVQEGFQRFANNAKHCTRSSSAQSCLERAGENAVRAQTNVFMNDQIRNAGSAEEEAALRSAGVLIDGMLRDGEIDKNDLARGINVNRNLFTEQCMKQASESGGVGTDRESQRAVRSMCSSISGNLANLLVGNKEAAIENIKQRAINLAVDYGANFLIGLLSGEDEEDGLGLGDLGFGKSKPKDRAAVPASEQRAAEIQQAIEGAFDGEDPVAAVQEAEVELLNAGGGSISPIASAPTNSSSTPAEAASNFTEPTKGDVLVPQLRLVWPQTYQGRVGALTTQDSDDMEKYVKAILASPRAQYRLAGKFTAPAMAALFESEEQFASQELQLALLRENTIQTAAAGTGKAADDARVVSGAIDVCIGKNLGALGLKGDDPQSYAQAYMMCQANGTQFARGGDTALTAALMETAKIQVDNSTWNKPWTSTARTELGRGFDLSELGIELSSTDASPALASCPSPVTSDTNAPMGRPPVYFSEVRSGIVKYVQNLLQTQGVFLDAVNQVNFGAGVGESNAVALAQRYKVSSASYYAKPPVIKILGDEETHDAAGPLKNFSQYIIDQYYTLPENEQNLTEDALADIGLPLSERSVEILTKNMPGILPLLKDAKEAKGKDSISAQAIDDRLSAYVRANSILGNFMFDSPWNNELSVEKQAKAMYGCNEKGVECSGRKQNSSLEDYNSNVANKLADAVIDEMRRRAKLELSSFAASKKEIDPKAADIAAACASAL